MLDARERLKDQCGGELERKPQELRGVLLAYLREKIFFIAMNGFLHSNERLTGEKQPKIVNNRSSISNRFATERLHLLPFLPNRL